MFLTLLKIITLTFLHLCLKMIAVAVVRRHENCKIAIL